MDVNKNSYTFTFAAVMVIVVAAMLSFAATSLKPMQDNNIRLEKMQNILSSINIEVSREEAEEAYDKYITKEVVINNSKEVSGIAAFDVEMSKEVAKAPMERNAPLYIADKDGETYYIIPMRGKGLWGPIWGYISLEKNVSTIYGATFDHKSETPGLGAEIKGESFTSLFPGKEMLEDNGSFTGIQVMKGNASGEHQVNGISGGTITSVGVQTMISDCMKSYVDYLKTVKTASAGTMEDNRLATIDQ
ncbi:NADH:ubiquinone reductase (Na(+)-transporting) subunit C [Croceimicrobium hydrocarbonivorans]|uniref:Na(+)-translocating NADH-quinone reductase subunit C n=1 Tax=Croceimicrobium hydrocarbonivorans TaxID=2761580 RepID=A0A7H0VFW9_9FLAO|nr:NADH:ubiquinone reductase (Na(+)-transporting) subunit C [Croceimicrobium hydrocarbonivorans]QNR24617.1 NADH:ubiquinone reductase (Na(+)-transporting) subunit C [Croceimicrobium hydrocarbonivorans]